MATNCLSSAIIEAPIEDIWEQLKDFRFPSKFFSSVSSVEIIGSPFQVGSVRIVKWKSGEVQTHKLLELSEQFLKISWELESSENIEECDGLLTTLQLRRVTETNYTYISWTSWFSANRTSSFMKWITKATQENISEIRQVITGKRIPVLRHIHEGPSTRVLWLCYELGIPIRVIVKDLFPKENLRESGQEFDLLRSTTGKLLMDPTGSLNPAFLTEDKETLHESGAIILHLLEQYDKSFKFHPPPSTKGRGTFYQWFFFTTATCDPLLLSSYIDLFVNLQEERNEEQLLINKQKWLEVVCEVLEKWITSNGGYIHGKEFSAADVMVGYTINLADSLGWLPEDNQVLQDYFQRLKERSAFQKAFDPPE